MFLTSLCVPALIYFVFQLTHIMVSIFHNKPKAALLQIILGVLMVMLLQLLCMKGMNIISWIIVFLPFMFYTYTTMIIYYVFGLNPEGVEIEVEEETDNDDGESSDDAETSSNDELRKVILRHNAILENLQEDVYSLIE